MERQYVMATMTVETQEMEMRIWDMGNTMCSSALHWWFSLIAGILRRVRNRGRDREREKARDREGGVVQQQHLHFQRKKRMSFRLSCINKCIFSTACS